MSSPNFLLFKLGTWASMALAFCEGSLSQPLITGRLEPVADELVSVEHWLLHPSALPFFIGTGLWNTNQRCVSGPIKVGILEVHATRKHGTKKQTYIFLHSPKELNNIADHGTEAIVCLNVRSHPRRKLIPGFCAFESELHTQHYFMIQLFSIKSRCSSVTPDLWSQRKMAPKSSLWRITLPIAWLTARDACCLYHSCPDRYWTTRHTISALSDFRWVYMLCEKSEKNICNALLNH